MRGEQLFAKRAAGYHVAATELDNGQLRMLAKRIPQTPRISGNPRARVARVLRIERNRQHGAMLLLSARVPGRERYAE